MSDGFWTWYEEGVHKGWCSEIVCNTHDGIPMTDKELEEWLEGNDKCVVAVRIYGTEKLDEEQ